MKYSPKELLDYIMEEEKEMEFFTALMQHVQGYSIAEITDAVFSEQEGAYQMHSEMFALELAITEDDIQTAIHNKLYISGFLSRYNDVYQVHFLVHPYPERFKEKFEEEITRDVVHYMIMQAIVTLKLDTKGKVKSYMESVGNQFLEV